MPHPFELSREALVDNLEAMVDVTFGDITSQFLTLPKGNGYIPFEEFQNAYETLKRETGAFKSFTEPTVWASLRSDSLVLVVLRTILGLSPPEWADLASSETGVEVPMGAARTLDTRVRLERDLFARGTGAVTTGRVEALVRVAVSTLSKPAPDMPDDTLHRLDKFDTKLALDSLAHAANNHVPYAVLLYERYLGRPFASHRDSVSELIGDVMESAIEGQLATAKITFRKTGRAERIPGFEQAPDFFVPTEVAPSVIIEAKITGDDGTARDKVARILRLAAMRDERIRAGKPSFEVIACVDGRGFGVRRQDMRDMLQATNGKVFTLATLPKLIEHSALAKFLPRT
jgi:hypothetical protein